jgi:hypothetical protein
MKNLVSLAIIIGLVSACDSKTEEQQTTAAPATTTTGAGGAGTGGTGTGGAVQPPKCSVAADCPVPEGCLTCPGETQCRPYTASCIEGTCGVEQPQCPAGTGGAGTGGAPATGGAAQGGSGTGGATTTSTASGGAGGK